MTDRPSLFGQGFVVKEYPIIGSLPIHPFTKPWLAPRAPFELGYYDIVGEPHHRVLSPPTLTAAFAVLTALLFVLCPTLFVLTIQLVKLQPHGPNVQPLPLVRGDYRSSTVFGWDRWLNCRHGHVVVLLVCGP